MKYLRYLILLVVLLMLIAGLSFGEIGVVLHKASQVCLECIGIG
jgi:hypothetical protein